MNGETNEKLDNLNVEDAFSDLISEYFEEGNNPQNSINVQTGPVLDWDSVANGQLYTNIAGNVGGLKNQINNAETIGYNNKPVNAENNGLLYNNLETINGENNTIQKAQNTNFGLYNNLEVTGGEYANSKLENTGVTGEHTDNGETTNDTNQQTQNCTNGLYDELGNLNTKEIVKNAYKVATFNGKLIQEVNNDAEPKLGQANIINPVNTNGTDFKLTQGNLPAKIGFWTKVRNFFISDSKIQYSVQSSQNNGGVLNKLQNFFSFGKNK